MWSRLINWIDGFLNGITMYRLVLYLLIIFNVLGVGLSWFHLLPFDALAMLFSIGFILIATLASNVVFAAAFGAPTNSESVYITALILSLIISPPTSPRDVMFLFWASVLASASKYILAIRKKHLFNPVAVAVVLTSLGFDASASWWVGNAYLAIPVAIGAFLIIRKIKRYDLANGFLFTVITVSLGLNLINGTSMWQTLNTLFFHSSLLFFLGVMLTEPLTSPPTETLQFMFGSLVGFLFAPQVHLGTFFATPEQALVIGNLFAYIVSPKLKLLLTLTEKIQIGPDTFDFLFSPNQKVAFVPGQYMEWTLAHDHVDTRGNRRYFTLASSPTEPHIRISVKFPPKSSSFKQALLTLGSSPIVASQLSGDFTLPKNQQEKLVFMAGGIGVTPFRSMVKYLIDTNQRRDIIVLYSNKTAEEVVYREVFDEAAIKLGIKVVYHLTSESGHFDAQNLPQLVPDFQDRTYYISGPRSMVTASENLLKQLGVVSKRIKTDFFPGFV